MSYSVWIERNGNWYRTDNDLNEIAAESIANYYRERGHKVKIVAA